MRKTLPATVVIMGFALATPLLADNSTSTVFQSNSGNLVDVNLAGAIAGAQSLIDQSGANNVANVTQFDDGSDIGGVAPPINDSTILQSGDGNSATLMQDTSTFQLFSASYIEQIGDNNSAVVTQYDDAQDSSIAQISDGNTAIVIQGDSLLALTDESYGNSSSIVQDGLGGHYAEISQTGLLNTSEITQFGENNTIYVAQLGDFNDSFASQDGVGHWAEISQSGDGNLSELFQIGNGHEAYLVQLGNSNYSMIDQSGSGNWASVSQSSDNNTSIVIQSGANNTAQVSQ